MVTVGSELGHIVSHCSIFVSLLGSIAFVWIEIGQFRDVSVLGILSSVRSNRSRMIFHRAMSCGRAFTRRKEPASHGCGEKPCG